ncbi:extensin-like [Zingiber officinale]|uniref:extensin-like n=1 Tax=Zingiber officinale TaxID=94328 RepID=UPI001C4BB676|nr:extensin-like [Zingiber officinale]
MGTGQRPNISRRQIDMRQGTRVPMPRRGAGRPRKRALESLATESPEKSIGIEPISQGQTPHDTAGASGSRIPKVHSPELPAPTVSTVPPAVPSATYSTPPPAVPATTYPVPPPPVPAITYPTPATLVTLAPTTYLAPAPAIPVAPYLVPPLTVPPAAPAYIDPVVPPVVPSSAYAAALGVRLPTYLAVPLVVPAPVVPPVPAMIPTHPTDMIAARARIQALAESMKSRFTLFRG